MMLSGGGFLAGLRIRAADRRTIAPDFERLWVCKMVLGVLLIDVVNEVDG